MRRNRMGSGHGQWLRGLLMSLALLGAAVGLPAGRGMPAQAAGYPVGFAPTHEVMGNYYGLGTYMALRYPNLVGPAVRRVQAAGTNWVKEGFTVTRLHKGTHKPYDFKPFDRVVKRERRAGLHILGVLDYNNSFLHKGSTWMPHKRMKKLIADYVLYVRAVVKHYRNEIQYWQVWNEPDIHDFWHPVPHAGDYAHLLRAAYRVIKKTNPKAQVVVAGPSGRDTHAVQFLHKVSAAGGRFDVVAIQPYVDVPNASLSAEISELKSFHKPIWFSEMGWAGQSSCGPCGAPGYQAQRLSTLFLIAGLGGVQRVFWYDLRDDGVRPIFPDHFGLLEWNLAAKSAFHAYEVGLYFMNQTTVTGIDHLTPLLTLYRLLKNGHTYFILWNSSPSSSYVTLNWNTQFVRVVNGLGKGVGGSSQGFLGLNVGGNSIAYLAPPVMKPPRRSPRGIPIFPGHTR